MIEFFSENLGTIIVCIVLAGIVAAIVGAMIRAKRNGKSTCSCGGDCSCCPSGCARHKK